MVYVPRVWGQLKPSAKQSLQWLVINNRYNEVSYTYSDKNYKIVKFAGGGRR